MLLVGSVAAADVPELGEPETREEVRELHIGNGLATREYVRYISASNALHLALKSL